jgi:hypothetical protein
MQTSGNELWIRESGDFLQYAFLSGATNANLFTNTIDISAADEVKTGWLGKPPILGFPRLARRTMLVQVPVTVCFQAN